MSSSLPLAETKQVLFWPRWAETGGLDALFKVLKAANSPIAFLVVLRHEPHWDPPLDACVRQLNALKVLHSKIDRRFSMSILSEPWNRIDRRQLAMGLSAIFLWPGRANPWLRSLDVPVAHTIDSLHAVLSTVSEVRSPSQIFHGNLEHVSARDPSLAERLRRAAPGEHLRQTSGKWEIRFRRHWVTLETEPRLSDLDSKTKTLVLGIGLGQQVDRLLAMDFESVVAWDRDPWMLCVALSQRDWGAAIREGRLRLVLGPDILTIPQGYTQIVEHGLLRMLYSREIALWKEPARPVALVVNGELFVDDIADALSRRGFSLYTWDTLSLTSEELTYIAKRLSPSFIIGINYQRGLGEACAKLGVPLVIWEIDPALDVLQPCETITEDCHVFTWRKRQVDDWKRAGFVNVKHLPLGANHFRRTPGLVSPNEQRRYGSLVSFVGSSLGDNVDWCKEEFLRLWSRWSGIDDLHEPEALIQEILTRHHENPEEYVVAEMLRERFPGFAPDECQPAAPQMLLGELVAHQYRLQVVGALGSFGIHVWGDQGWRNVKDTGAVFQGPASHNHDVTRVYRASLINIDVGRRYQRDIVTMRVFDVLACGGFVLAEDCDDLRTLFEPGVHLDTWTTVEELVEKTEWYANRPDKVAQIRKAGHQRLLEAHTIDQRVGVLLHPVVQSKMAIA
jgi:hypothetical protein